MKKVIVIITTLLLLPIVAQAKTWYITQGMGMQTWVVALSTRADNVELIHEAYGDGVIREERLRMFARGQGVSFWEAA